MRLRHRLPCPFSHGTALGRFLNGDVAVNDYGKWIPRLVFIDDKQIYANGVSIEILNINGLEIKRDSPFRHDEKLVGKNSSWRDEKTVPKRRVYDKIGRRTTATAENLNTINVTSKPLHRRRKTTFVHNEYQWYLHER